MGSAQHCSLPAFFCRHLKLFVSIFIIYKIISFGEVNAYPSYSDGQHQNREVRSPGDEMLADGKGQNARQSSLVADRLLSASVGRSGAPTGKGEQPQERRRNTRVTGTDKTIHINSHMERDPSSDSDEKTRAVKKSPTVKITAPVLNSQKATTKSPLVIEVKTFTPKPNISAVIKVITNTSNATSKYKETKERKVERNDTVGNVRPEASKLLNWYAVSSFTNPRDPLGTLPAPGAPKLLPYEEIILLGPDTGYNNQQAMPIYPQYAAEAQDYLPIGTAFESAGYDPNLVINPADAMPLIPNAPVGPQWIPGMQPINQKYVTSSFKLKSNPKMEWVPI